MEYLSIRQTAEKWGLSKRRVQVLCVEGRIPGAMKVDSSWVIPANAEKPKDERIKSGRYVKMAAGQIFKNNRSQKREKCNGEERD